MFKIYLFIFLVLITFINAISIKEFENISDELYINIFNSTKFGNSKSLENERNELVKKYQSIFKNAPINKDRDPTSEVEAREVLNAIISEYNNIKKDAFKDVLKGEKNYYIRFVNFINQKYAELIYYQYKDFKDEKLKHQFRIFTESSLLKYPSSLAVQERIQHSSALIKYNIEEDRKIEDIKTLEDLTDRWNKVRSLSPKAIRELHSYLMLFATYINGYQSYADYRYSKFNTENFLGKVKNILDELRPFYLQLHAYVRHLLHKKHGEEIVSEKGPIPHYLLEQLLIKAESTDSDFEYPISEKGFFILSDPSKKNLSLNDISNLAKTCDEFYQSIGFSDLPEKLWSERVILNYDEDCQGFAAVTDDSSALAVCKNLHFMDYLELYSNLAQIHSYELIKNFPSAFMEETYPLFAEGIGNAVQLSVLTPEYLTKIGFLDGNIDEETNLNRLYRLALPTIFSISQFYVYEKFYTDFLDFNLNVTNCDYWQLENEIRGVESSFLRDSNMFDIPMKYIKSQEHIVLLNDILGFSVYKNLCKITGEYIPGDETHPLNTCNLYGNKKAGELLISILSADPSRYWNDILNEVFGEDGFNPSGILEYFEPLKVWLENENKKNKIFVGWEDSNHCQNEV